MATRRREAAQGCSHGRASSLRCRLQLLPLSPLPATLAFLLTTVGSNWTQFLVKLCKVGVGGQQGEPQQLGTGRNSKLQKEPETHCAVAKLTKAVQNVLKPVNTLQQQWCQREQPEGGVGGHLTSSAQKRWAKTCPQAGSSESPGAGGVAGALKL